MRTANFIDEFLHSDFAKKNLFTHLQIGFPMPLAYENGIAVRCFFHKLICTEKQITLSGPRFEIILSYPSGRIIYFSPLDDKTYHTTDVVITKKQVENLEYTFEQMYDACDEVIGFYDEYQKVTDVIYKQYYNRLEKVSKSIDMADWYGGLYDSDGSI